MASSKIDRFRSSLHDNVYSCMELSKQSWDDVMNMPVQRLHDYLKWKTDLEEEKQKLIKERTGGT